MEHASDAIIMAGAILIFVIALSTAMLVFSQARATTDAVMYASDETNFYEYLGDLSNTGSSIESRTVGWETVIPTLYKYYKENYTVVFLDKDGNPLHLYTTKTNENLWSGNKYKANKDVESYAPIVNKYYSSVTGNSTTKKEICSFDLAEEGARHEPWVGQASETGKEEPKLHLKAFLEGKNFEIPGNAIKYNYKDDYSTGNEAGFIQRVNSKCGGEPKFTETIGEYRTDKDPTEEQEIIRWNMDNGIRNKKSKRVIVYQLTNATI